VSEPRFACARPLTQKANVNQSRGSNDMTGSLATWFVTAFAALVAASAPTAIRHEQAASPPTSAGKSRPVTRSPATRRTSPEFDTLAAAAHAAREGGRLEEAAALYGKAIQLRPAWTEGKWYLGTTFYEMERYADARVAFRAVTAAQPTNGPAYGMKGICEFRLKDYESALSDLMTAEQLGLGGNQQLEGSIRYHAGIIMTRLGQYEFALLQLSWLAQRGNDSPRVMEAFGLAALRIPMLPEELSTDRREMVMLAGEGAYFQAAQLNSRATPVFEQLVNRYADTPNVHYAFALFLLGENPDRAIEEIRSELKISPGHVPALLQIAFEYIKRSDWHAAEPWARQAVENAPTDVVAHRALGQVLLELGDVPGAIQQLETGLELAPDSQSLHFVLARAYRKAGRSADARRHRLEFERLQRETRTAQFGEQAVGGAGRRSP
jgi:tetratricopeptide (TPR) repeat protein